MTNASIETLSILLMSLQLDDLMDDRRPSLPLQLMTVDLHCMRRSMHAYPIGGYLAPAVVDWMRKKTAGTKQGIALEEVEEVMRRSFIHVLGRFVRWGDQFMAEIRPPHQLYLACPGDACEMATSYEDAFAGHGTTLDCHNVDIPAQQLCFLMGLAKFHEILREEGV